MAALDFWFDFASTYSWLSAMRIGPLAEAEGVELRWRPFLLGVFFKARGLGTSPFNVEPQKGRHMWRDVERRAARLGLGFAYRGWLPEPGSFPRQSLRAARVMAAAEGEPWAADFARAVFTAEFSQGKDIADDALLADALRQAGADPAHWLSAADGQAVKDRLRAETEEALARGIFGAPSFTVGSELFWGDDRLEEALDWALGRHPAQGVPD